MCPGIALDRLPTALLAKCCAGAGDGGAAVTRLACCSRAGAEGKSALWAALFNPGARVVLHGLTAATLNGRLGVVETRGTDVGAEEDRVGVRLDGESRRKAVRCKNLRLARALWERGEPDEVHESYFCDHCQVKPIRGVRFRCLGCGVYDLCLACFRAGATHACFDGVFVPHSYRVKKQSMATMVASGTEQLRAFGRTPDAEALKHQCARIAEMGPRSAAIAKALLAEL